MRKLLAVAVALALCAIVAFPVHAARLDKSVLISWSQDDTTEQKSKIVNITDAAYVILRCTSTHAAFNAATDADSTRSDSLIAFNVFLSDSICCVVGGLFSNADSVLVPVSTTPDTTVRGVIAGPLPINKPLRAPATGSGRYTIVAPVTWIAPTISYVGTVPGQKLFVRYTPLRRNTVTGGNSTQGKRVVGLKGFRLWADIYR